MSINKKWQEAQVLNDAYKFEHARKREKKQTCPNSQLLTLHQSWCGSTSGFVH
jgi:hypothetical protein